AHTASSCHIGSMRCGRGWPGRAEAMFSVPWWLWSLVGLLAIGILFVRQGARAWNARIRTQFVQYLKEYAADVQIVEVREREILVRTEAGDGVLSLHNLFIEVAKLDAADDAGRQAVFGRFVHMLRESAGATRLTEADRDRIRPRIVTDRHLARLRTKEGTPPA